MQHQQDFIYFKPSDRDPHYLRNVLTAHFHLERLRSARRFLTNLVIPLSIVVWLTSARLHAIALQLWVVSMIGTAILGLLELRWYRRRTRLMRENE